MSLLVPRTPSPKKKRAESQGRKPQQYEQKKLSIPDLITPATELEKSSLLDNLNCKNKVDDKRDENLALIEHIPFGPIDFNKTHGYPEFDALEPYSKIRLKKRCIKHDDLQNDYFTARHIVTISQLYSLALAKRDGGYDVPFPGEWIVVGVLSQKRMSVTTTTNTGDPQQNQQVQQRKYVSFKFLDLGVRGAGGGSGIMDLRIFEQPESKNTKVVKGKEKNEHEHKNPISTMGTRKKKTAFERYWKLQDGDVVALMNPRFMKRRENAENLLSLVPDSAEGLRMIGTSLDLGTCEATKKDGNRCTSWVDKRVNDTCDFHIEQALKRQRAGRAELFIGTSGMNTRVQKVGHNGNYGVGLSSNGNSSGNNNWKGGSWVGKSKPQEPAFDREKKIGLLPDSNTRTIEGSKVFICGGGGSGGDNNRMMGRGASNLGGGIAGKRGFGNEDARRRSSSSSASTSFNLAGSFDQTGTHIQSDKERLKRKAEQEKRLEELLRNNGEKGYDSVGDMYFGKLNNRGDKRVKTDPSTASTGKKLMKDAKENNKMVFNAKAIKAIGFDPHRRDDEQKKKKPRYVVLD